MKECIFFLNNIHICRCNISGTQVARGCLITHWNGGVCIYLCPLQHYPLVYPGQYEQNEHCAMWVKALCNATLQLHHAFTEIKSQPLPNASILPTHTHTHTVKSPNPWEHSLSTENVNIGVIHVAGGQNRLRHNTPSAHTKHSVSRTNCLMHNTRVANKNKQSNWTRFLDKIKLQHYLKGNLAFVPCLISYNLHLNSVTIVLSGLSSGQLPGFGVSLLISLY